MSRFERSSRQFSPSRRGAARALLRASLLTGGLGLLASCAAGVPTPPTVGSWNGTEGGDTIVALTLEGAPGSTSGRYDLGTETVFAGSHGPGFDAWSGTWSSHPSDGVPGGRTVIDLHDVPTGDIDQYVIAADGDLQPTDADAGRRLTAAELRLYSLSPGLG